ncbi:MAG TPA: sialidase family protein [Abditibacteriaceae bacterium]|nr:sialidase family protein [Abditibacteriaceae bacterium]
MINVENLTQFPIEAGSRRFAREQEGFARSLSVPADEIPRCSTAFQAFPASLSDFRGLVPDENGRVPGGSAPHGDRTFVEWETSAAQSDEATIFTWIGSSLLRPAMHPAYPHVAATLFVDGVARLQFPIGRPSEYAVSQDGFALQFEPRRFQSLVEIPHRVWKPHGVSGFYRLEVPAQHLTAGQPLRLRIELPPAQEGVETFYYVSPRTDVLSINLAVLRDSVAQLQTDMVQLKASHEMLYAQVYPQLFPGRIKGELIIAHQDETLHLHPPHITALRDGELVITMREAIDHLAIDGRIIAVRSRDDGKTWSDKELLFDLGQSDHRSSPIFELPNGEWITTDYRCASDYNNDKGAFDLLAPVQGPTQWGAWSTDRGKTWNFSEEPMTVPGAYHPYVETERHMIQLPSGRLLVPGNYVEAKPNGEMPDYSVYRIAVFASDDGGRSWAVLSHLPYHQHTIGEATILRTSSGKLLLLSRTQGEGEGWMEKGGLLQAVSHDDGQTWSEWEQSGMSSEASPGHLLQLQDGRILCTHASRVYPGSIYVTLSGDEGVTWDTANTRIVTNDIPNLDACYPNSAQLADGTIITVWYANLFGKFFIAALRWPPEQLPAS